MDETCDCPPEPDLPPADPTVTVTTTTPLQAQDDHPDPEPEPEPEPEDPDGEDPGEDFSKDGDSPTLPDPDPDPIPIDFSFLSPGAFPLIRRNVLDSDSTQEYDKRRVVVVSVIGTGSAVPSSSGFKRAFRLAVDVFGNSKLFKDDADTDNCKGGRGSEGVDEVTQLLEEMCSLNPTVSDEEKRNGDKKFECPMGESTESEDNPEDGNGDTTKTINDDKTGMENVESEHMEEKRKGVDFSQMCCLDGFYSERASTIFLHLTGLDDPLQLLAVLEELGQDVEHVGFYSLWSSLKSIHCRYLLLMFSLSHVILVSEVGQSLNTNYIQLFRILDSVRQQIKSSLSRTLEKVKGLHKDWVHYARICSPRLLFLFEIKQETNSEPVEINDFFKSQYTMKQSEIEMEDELYHIFRKCRIITNISANSLFALPAQDSFVFLLKCADHRQVQDIQPLDVYDEIIEESYQMEEEQWIEKLDEMRIEALDALIQDEEIPDMEEQYEEEYRELRESVREQWRDIQREIMNRNSEKIRASADKEDISVEGCEGFDSQTRYHSRQSDDGGSTSEWSTEEDLLQSCDVADSVTFYERICSKFKGFLLKHIRLALRKGFDDNNRKVADYKHFFIVPTLGDWKKGFRAIHDAIIRGDNSSRKMKEGLEQLSRYLQVDSEYLHNQCSNAFPKIYQVYQRGLPEFYSERTHRIRLAHAMNAYFTISRNSSILVWLTKLEEKCELYWKRGRQLCEILSLFGHPCTSPLHRVPADNNLEIMHQPTLDANLPEMKHSAGAKIVSYCNCGKKQGYRDEPFTIREANYGFYQRMGKDCCENLDKVEFPTFVATNGELSAEEMLRVFKKNMDKKRSRQRRETDLEENANPRLSQMLEIGLRQDEGDDEEENSQDVEEDENSEVVYHTRQDDEENALDGLTTHDKAGMSSQEDPVSLELWKNTCYVGACDENERIDLLTEDSGAEDATMEKQYLPGMTHNKIPSPLLPKFSSWSLVRLGTSSLYNHSSGIAPRAVFLSGVNYLLPMDVKIQAEAGVSKPVPRMIRGRRYTNKPKPISGEFTVKVFYGFEYECHRGHRMIANDAESVINFNIGNAGLKDAASKILTTEMPLYFRCPCKESRDGKLMLAQMMRLHIITPKAPVHCMISPQVQPAPPPSPIFHPEIPGPIRLTPSSYWVLRLPYCYVGEQIYCPFFTSEESLRTHAKLLRGVLNVEAMTQSETKVWEKENL